MKTNRATCTSEEVANSLRRRGITGRRQSYRQNPLSNYLRSLGCPDIAIVGVGIQTFAYRFDADRVPIHKKDWERLEGVMSFIYGFYSGDYDDLCEGSDPY